MAFNDTIMKEYASIRGRKIDTGDGPVFVEDLINREGVPHVMLSNDECITLMEALNFPIWTPPANGGGGGGMSGGSHFPDVKYDENGIPTNLGTIATTEEDMNEVEQKFGDPGKSALNTKFKRLQGSPLQTLLEGAKKDGREFTLTFHTAVVSPTLYEVLKESYPDENIDDILSNMIAGDIIEGLTDIIKQNILTILTSTIKPLTYKDDAEKEKNNITN